MKFEVSNSCPLSKVRLIFSGIHGPPRFVSSIWLYFRLPGRKFTFGRGFGLFVTFTLSSGIFDLKGVIHGVTPLVWCPKYQHEPVANSDSRVPCRCLQATPVWVLTLRGLCLGASAQLFLWGVGFLLVALEFLRYPPVDQRQT